MTRHEFDNKVEGNGKVERVQTWRSSLPALSFLTLTTAFGFPAPTSAQPSSADLITDQRCTKDAESRLIELRFADPEGNLPCNVTSRPTADAENDAEDILSWQDIDSLDSCKDRVQDVIDGLSDEGWTCTAAGDDLIGPENINLATDTDAEDANVVAADDIDVEADIPARFVENPDLPEPTSDLVSLVENDLEQLDTTLDGLLEAMVAGYGDLNGDDIDDALVLYTYTSPQPAYRQFLIAYLHDGDTYQLTATKPISGNISATSGAKVETIDRGVVHLMLKVYEPLDDSCCPSGERHLAFALRELELVEIDTDAPTR